MKRSFIFSVFFILSAVSVQAQVWFSSFEMAQTIAKGSNKLILIDFYADWCGPCKKMDFETWSDSGVKVQLEKMIPAKINIDLDRSLATKYNVKAIPAIFIVDAWGNILHKDLGFKTAEEIENLLLDFPGQVKDIYHSLEALEGESKAAKLNCNAAEAYQNTAKNLKGKAKNIFLKESNSYFTKARKLYKKEKNLMAVERVELLQFYNQLLAERAMSVVKKLEKDGVENYNESNKALACFIATKAYLEIDNKSEAAAFHEKLKACDDCADYLEELAELNPD